MRIIGTVFWALLIGAAIAYVLASMGNDPFNMAQSLAFSAITFIGVLIVDLALSANKEQ